MNNPLAPPKPPQLLAEIAARLACSDEQFDRAFRRAQAGRDGSPFSIFSRGSSSLTGRRLFERGLELAWTEGWLTGLLGQLVVDSLFGGPPPGQNIAGAPAATPEVELQELVRGLGRFGDPDDLARGSRAVPRFCGRVLIDGEAAGSGFLIGPDLFLTAWHVVGRLITLDAVLCADGKAEAGSNGSKRAWTTDSAKRIRIEFDYSRRRAADGQEKTLDYGRIRPVKVARDWLMWGAPAPALKDKMPDPDGFCDDWDYAVIRLAEPIGNEYAPARLEPRSLPNARGRLWIFQFPAAMPLRYDAHDFLGVYGKGEERFYYKVEAARGSSGGPCLDDEFQIVGMHLAAWLKNTPLIDSAPVNFGVPVTKLLDHLQHCKVQLAPHPSTAGLRRLRDDTHPVVGRWDFQLLVWNALLDGLRRILIVPDDKAPGRGKSFLGQVLESMLPPLAHHVAYVSAEALAKAGLQEGYRLLLARLGAAERGIERPRLAGAMPFLRTTPAARPRDSLVPDFIRLAGEVRGERTVWIIIDELDRHEVEDLELREFLYLLYQQVLSVSWLRFMLIGFKGDMPALGQAQSYVLRYPNAGALSPLSAQDVNAHIAALIGEYGADWTEAAIEKRAAAIVAEAGDPSASEYAQAVALKVLEAESEILPAPGGGG